MGVALVRIAGVTFNNDDGSSRQEILSRMRKGRKLRFRDAATEEHPNAISVHNVKGEQLGFLTAEDAEYIRKRMIDPRDLIGEVFSISKNKDGSAYGCLINVEHNDIQGLAIGYHPGNKLAGLTNRTYEKSNRSKDNPFPEYSNVKHTYNAATDTDSYEIDLSSKKASATKVNSQNDFSGCLALCLMIGIPMILLYFLVKLLFA